MFWKGFTNRSSAEGNYLWQGQLFGSRLHRWLSTHPFWPFFILTAGYNVGYLLWAIIKLDYLNVLFVEGGVPAQSVSSLLLSLVLGFLVILLILLVRLFPHADALDWEARWLKEVRRVSLLNLLLPALWLLWMVQGGWFHLEHWLHVIYLVAAVPTIWTVTLLATRLFPGEAGFRRLAKWFRPGYFFASVTLLLVAGILVVGIMRHQSFNSNGYDMALFDQMLWRTAHGDFLHNTLLLPGSSISMMAFHFSPMVGLLAPLYWIAPHPATLIVVQSAAIGLTALFVYLTTLRMTGRRGLAAAFATVFLMNPLLHDGALFDFHQDALGMMFMALTLMGVAYGRRSLMAGGWCLSLLCKEEIALYWAVFALFMMVVNREQWRRHLFFSGTNLLILLLLIQFVIPSFDFEANAGFHYFHRYEELGQSPTALLGTMLLNPLYFLRVLIAPGRVEALLILTLPFLPLLFYSDRRPVLLLAPLAINLLSSFPPQYRLTVHYTMLPSAFLLFAAAYCARYALQKVESTEQRAAFSSRISFYSLMTGALLFGILSPIGLRLGPESLERYRITGRDRLAHELVRMIPAEAPVSAQSHLTPHLSQRQDIVFFPFQTHPRKVEYIMLDVIPRPHGYYPLTQDDYRQEVYQLLQNSEYGPIFVGNGYILLERGASRERVGEAMKLLNRWVLNGSQ